MKKLFFAVLVMIGMTSFAQEAKPMAVKQGMTSEQKSDVQLKRLMVELNLDANQQKEMQAILTDGVSKRAEMTKELDAKRPTSTQKEGDVREKRKMVLNEYNTIENTKLQKVLTPEQFAKYEKITKEREDKMNASK